MSAVPPIAEVILSFDNLGEAAEEERGLPVGPPPHFSVVEILPRVVALLDEASLRATFCVEAINVERYPEALGSLVEQGHELACHAWRHESWHSLDVPTRQEVLRRSLAALRSLDTEVTGFRPPGGLLDDADFAGLAGQGIRWVSPAGSRAGLRDAVVCLPFAWRAIDAYYFAPALAPLRRGDGRSGEPLDPADFARVAARAVDEALRAPEGEPLCLVLHPFLYTSEERFEVLAELMGRLAGLHAAGEAHVGTARAAAERLRRRPGLAAPELDRSTWSG